MADGLLPHEFMLRRRRPAAVRRRRRSGRRSGPSLEQYSRVLPLDETAWASFAERIVYQRVDFDDPAASTRLAARLDEHRRASTGRAATACSTSPPSRRQFAEIVGQLGRVGLDHERHDGGWRRVVIEKPFGHDLDSAKRLNREVGKVFGESQVYRIDHYLGKETVRNLLVFRFGNGIFEPLWNRRYVDHVQITVAESIGVEGRGAFYEETGASRDILQNHLLQLLSLVAMEPPATFEADALRDEKVKVLRAIAEPTRPTPARRRRPRPVRPGLGRRRARSRATARRRRSIPSPRRRRSSPPSSTIDDWRWAGVPFYLRTGKRLPKRATEIAIQFKEVPHRLFRDEGVGPGAEPARDPDPARRGDHAPLRGQGPGPRASTSGR